jgi:hypothetical protein
VQTPATVAMPPRGKAVILFLAVVRAAAASPEFRPLLLNGRGRCDTSSQCRHPRRFFVCRLRNAVFQLPPCRHCYRLAYQSQRETAHGRALLRAQAIRERLGGSGSMAEDFPRRPKGMHRLTYYRLMQQYEEADARSCSPWLLRCLFQS